MGIKDSVINLVIRGRDLFSPAAKSSTAGAVELQSEIGKLNADLKDLGTQSKQVSKARELEIYGDMLRESMANAQSALASMQAEVSKLPQPSAEAVSALRRLREETTSLTEKYNQNEAKLKTVQTSLKSAGVDFSNLANEEKRLRLEATQLGDELSKLKGVKETAAKIDELRVNVSLAKTEYERTTSALKATAMQMEATTKPTQSLKDAHALARQEASRASAAYQKLNSDLSKHEASLQSVGISSNDVATIERELANRITELQIRISELNKAQKEIGSNNQLSAQLEKQKSALIGTKSAMELLQAEFDQVNASQREYGSRVAEAAKNAGIATKAFEQNEAKLKAVKTQLDQAGIEARDLAAAQGQLATSTANASAKLAEKQSKLRQIESASVAAAQGTATFRDSINGLTARILAFTATYVGLDRMLQGFKSIITTGGEFEVLQQQLIGVFGDVAKGEEAFQWAVNLDKRLPVSLNEVLQAFVMLKNNGIDPMDGTLEKMINANVRYGKGTETLLPIIRQLTQSWAKNKIQAEEVYVLVENGLPVWQLLEQATGRTTQELMKMSEAGQLTREHMKLLIDTMGESGAGVVEQRMKTWNALVTKFKSNLEQAENTIAQSGALDELKGELSGLNEELNKLAADGTLKRWGKEFAEGLHSAIVNAKGLFEAASNLAPAIKLLAEIFIGVKIAKFAGQLGDLIKLFFGAGAASAAAAEGVGAIAAAGAAAGAGAVATAEGVATAAAATSKLGEVFKKVGNAAKFVGKIFLPIQTVKAVGQIYDLIDAYFKMTSAQAAAKESAELAKETQTQLSGKYADLSKQLGITVTSMDQLDQLVKDGTIHYNDYLGVWEKGPATLEATSKSAQKAAGGIGQYTTEVENAAQRTKEAADTKAASFFQSIGIDAEQAAGKIGKTTQENIDNIHNLLATTNTDSGAIYLALNHAFDSAKNKEEINGLANEIESLRSSGRLSGEDLVKSYASAAKAAGEYAKTNSDGYNLQIDFLNKQKQAAEEAYKTTGLEKYKVAVGEATLALQKAKEEQEKAQKAASALAAAYETLGVTSTAALQDAAAKHKAAFEQITAAGTESIEQQNAAFLSWAQAEIQLAAATGKPVPAMLEAMAAAKGLSAELNNLISTTDKQKAATANTETALSSLGITSASVMKKMAADAEAAYNTVANSANATLEEQKAAFMKYAEASLTANKAAGELPPPLLASQAAALGLSGSLETLKASLASSGAAAETASQQYDVFDYRNKKAATGAESSVKTYTVMTPLFKAATLDMSKAASYMSMSISDLNKEIETQDGLIQKLSHSVGVAPDSFGQWIGSINKASIEVYQFYANAARAAKEVQGLQTALSENPSEVLVNRAEHALSKYKELGSQNLSGLKSAIDAAKAKMDSLNASVQSTLNSLRDQADELNNNNTAIENRRYQTQVAELEAKLAEAQAMQDKQAIADMKEALRLAQEIHNQKLATIKAEQAAAKKSSSSSSNSSSTSSSTDLSSGVSTKTVTVNFKTGSTITPVQVTDESQAAALLSALEQVGLRTA